MELNRFRVSVAYCWMKWMKKDGGENNLYVLT